MCVCVCVCVCVHVRERRGEAEREREACGRMERTLDEVSEFCCPSVPKLYPILCDPMDCSTPDFPVHHHLPEFAQTHVHRVGDAPTISSSVTPFSSCPHPCQHQGLFQSWLFTSGGHSIADAASVLQNTWVHRLGNPDDESRNFQGLGFFLSQMRGLN